MVTATLRKTQRQHTPPGVDNLSEIRLSAVLDECLDDIAEGVSDGARLDGLLPAAREEIEPLLEIAGMLRTQARAAHRLLG
jgi:hypothetical protein